MKSVERIMLNATNTPQYRRKRARRSVHEQASRITVKTVCVEGKALYRSSDRYTNRSNSVKIV
jgi:hypothetical protein